MADLQFKVADKMKWEALAPVAPAKKEDKYTPLLDALESGEIIQIATTDDKEAKGLRITLGRKSRSRGFTTEYRTEGKTLYVRKSDTPPAEPKKKKVAAKA